MEQLPDYVVDLLDNIAKENGFANYSTELSAGSKEGDGLLGVLVSVVISGTRHQNNTTTNDKLHLLCKLAPADPESRAACMSDVMFGREALAYEKMLPLFAEFQREKGLADDECFDSVPKCYAAICDIENDQMAIIMEDMRPKQYEMRSKKDPFAAQHSFAVVDQLAKFHAVSFALQDQRPEALEPFKHLDDVVIKFFERKPMTGNLLHKCYDRALGVFTDARHIAIIEELKSRTLETLKECLVGDACTPYRVICHGDTWINNILFQYNKEQTDKVDNVCLVDWQLMRYASPAIELHYKLISTTDKELRQTEYTNLMQHYHKTLSNAIRRMGSDPDKLYPLAAFEQDLKTFGKFAFCYSPLMVQMMFVEPDELADLDQLGAFKGDAQKKYSQRIIDLYTDLLEWDYYWK